MDDIFNLVYSTDFDLVIIGILFLLGFAFFVQLLYYFIFFYRLVFYKIIHQKNTNVPVSVIICARDEEENLQKFLPSVLNQNYPNFEVIVVNDCSNDSSETILAQFKEKYTNLYVTNIKKDELFSHGKKLALTVGIKAAKNEILILTDADCQAITQDWIQKIANKFDQDTQIVLGYGGYFKHKGFLNKLIRYDTLFVAIQYFSFALSGIPYMGVGRNLAYRKSFFFKNKGFASHLNILSGDDDLFVNQFAKKQNTKIQIEPESFTLSEPKTTFKEWILQKKRHFTTGNFYKFKHKLLLGSEILSRMFFYLSLLILLAFQKFLWILLSVFIIKMIVQLIVIRKATKIFNEKDLIFFGTFFDLFLLIINFKVYLSNLIARNKIQWK